ncbi:hypothetical protein SO802_027934 [Lithocarpus litseifolius]|uniref:Uncharacterized protein n=1 Tax=Lithocarpus litseifolius TaxID=425828 RepID=A0AAW2BP21_9ROSI
MRRTKKERKNGPVEAGVNQKDSGVSVMKGRRVVTRSSKKEKGRESQGNGTEKADMVEQSSDGLSGNWARHRNRRYKEKKEEVAEPEADPERDQRTVFAYQICLKANERDVYEFFSKAGKLSLKDGVGWQDHRFKSQNPLVDETPSFVPLALDLFSSLIYSSGFEKHYKEVYTRYQETPTKNAYISRNAKETISGTQSLAGPWHLMIKIAGVLRKRARRSAYAYEAKNMQGKTMFCGVASSAADSAYGASQEALVEGLGTSRALAPNDQNCWSPEEESKEERVCL